MSSWLLAGNSRNKGIYYIGVQGICSLIPYEEPVRCGVTQTNNWDLTCLEGLQHQTHTPQPDKASSVNLKFLHPRKSSPLFFVSICMFHVQHNVKRSPRPKATNTNKTE